METLDFKAVMDAIPSATLIGKPVTVDGKITDFDIIYVNDTFRTLTKNILEAGSRYSSIKEKVSQNVHWFDLAEQAIKLKSTVENTFYSHNLSIWIQFVAKCVLDDYVAICFTNVSDAKHYEFALSEQNKKLEEVSNQLEFSKINLDTQLKSIQHLNEQLLFAAYHDPLTDLYNRSWLSGTLKSQIDIATENNQKFAIILFGVDDMRNINDSRGHAAGDEILKRVATVLNMLESKDVVPTRFGGDEFVILCKNIQNRDEAAAFGEKVLRFLNVEGIKVSGGVSIFPDDSEKADDLLKFADLAKIESKRNGKNTMACFHAIMQEKFLNKLNIETKMSKAMSDKDFELYYQPQFDAKTRDLRGFEALLRWYDEDLGWISPDQFIPLAEETHLVIPLGDWVLKTSLSTLKDWEDRFNFSGIMSVNVSPVQFMQEDFLEKFFRKVEQSKINCAHLEIEVTEGVLIDNMDETVEKLKEVRKKGIGVSLDDFGTGYSSLRYLQILPLTTLKIDKSFISNIAKDGAFESKITESIINLVSKLGLTTIAEGVEDEEQLAVLQKLNLNTIQGYLFGKPMPRDLCEKLLAGDKSAVLTIKNS